MGTIGSYTSSAALTNIAARGAYFYTIHSVAIANLGAFTVELLNPDPNGTPGLEFTQGDELARGLKLLFKQSFAPLLKPVEKFIIETTKFDYIFGKLKYQNLKGVELEAFANSVENVGKKSVEVLKINQDRAKDIARTMEYWGIKDNKAGGQRLAELFNAALNGKIVESGVKVDKYGTSILREIPLIFVEGEKKGQQAGVLQVSYFYANSDMSVTPEISSVRAIPFGR